MGRRQLLKQVEEQRSERATRARTTSARGQRKAAEMAPALDAVIHERVRLGIVSALAVNDRLSFSDMKRLLNTTDGNLSVHARKLEDAGYISCSKFFEGRTPKTEYRLTSAGKHALERYLSEMEEIIKGTRG